MDKDLKKESFFFLRLLKGEEKRAEKGQKMGVTRIADLSLLGVNLISVG